MKSILIFLTLLTLSLSVYFTFQRFERHGVQTYRMYDGTNDVELTTKGKIVFNDAETAIESISQKGFLKYEDNETELKVEMKDGAIAYRLLNDGKKLNVGSPEGKLILTEVIKKILETGYDARGRAERLYTKGGASAVLTATTQMNQDFIKAVYLDFLAGKDSLTTVEKLEIIKTAATINSDYDKTKVLRAFTSAVRDTALAGAYLKAIAEIDADYEKAGILKNVIRQPLDSGSFHEVLKVTTSLQADHEKSGVISAMLKTGNLSPDRINGLLTVIKSIGADFEKSSLLRDLDAPLKDSITVSAYLGAVNSIQSDFEKARALELIFKQPISTSAFHEVAITIGSIGADHEKAGLVRRLLDRTGDQDNHVGRVLMVIHDMDGDFEKVNLMKKIADKAPAPEEDWVALLTEAGRVGNDSEKANVLIHIAGKMPKTETVKSAYLNAAKSINSEFDYGRAVKASGI